MQDEEANGNLEHVACIGSGIEKGTDMGTGGEVIWGNIVVCAWKSLYVGLSMCMDTGEAGVSLPGCRISNGTMSVS